jgi:hypothetical protein
MESISGNVYKLRLRESPRQHSSKKKKLGMERRGLCRRTGHTQNARFAQATAGVGYKKYLSTNFAICSAEAFTILVEND